MAHLLLLDAIKHTLKSSLTTAGGGHTGEGTAVQAPCTGTWDAPSSVIQLFQAPFICSLLQAIKLPVLK